MIGATPVYAQNTSEPGSDIIVTARRVEERLQDVPISISIYSQQQISNRNIVMAADLATYTPSLSVRQQFGPERASFSIRGFNQDLSTAPTVGVYFADVVGVRAENGTVTGNSVGAGAFMDLQNVQVLKGPQGTLFGRNTTGGAILVVPNKPNGELGGWVEGQGGNFGLKRVQAVINVPLSDTFNIRASFDRNHRDGYMINRSGIGPKDYNNINYFAARFGILAQLTPDLENYTVANYSNSFGHGYGTRMVACERDPAKRTGLLFLTAQAGCDQIDRQAAAGDGPFDIESSAPVAFVRIKQWQVINTTTWHASDELTVKNIASYGEYEERSAYNLASDNTFFGGKPFNFVFLSTGPGGAPNAHEATVTEELQLQGRSFGDRLDWVFGGYLESSQPLGFSQASNGILAFCVDPADVASCTNPLGIGNVGRNALKYTFNNRGIFGQATYKLTDKLSLTGGIRYTWDRELGESQATRVIGIGTPVTTLQCQDTLRFNGGTNPVTGAPVPKTVTDRSQCDVKIKISSSAPTWVIDVDYKPISDILMYAKYSRGYRQGGISLLNIGVETWQPEKVDAFEVGAKTSFRGPLPGFFNVAAFYNNLTNQQVNASFVPKPLSGAPSAAGPINAGKSRIEGIEADLGLTLLRGFNLDVSYAFLKTKIIDLVVPSLPANSPYGLIIPRVAKGDAATYAPRNKVTVTGTYALPLDDSIGKIALSMTYTHTDKQIAAVGETFPSDPKSPIAIKQLGVLPATDLVNLSANWERVLATPLDLGVFVTNLTNQVYPTLPTLLYPSVGYEGVMLGLPRMWGVRLRYTFGQ